MPATYRYNTSGSGVGSCDVCTDADGQEGTLDEIPEAPNPGCRNASDCNCSHEFLGDEPETCEDEGLVDCEDCEGFTFCGEPGDEFCGEDGCCCETGLDPQDGDEVECRSPYWDPQCACLEECEGRDE